MKAGKYSIRDLFVNNYIDQIIIPEIQRDYVWGEEQTIGLLENILEDYTKYKEGNVPVQTDDAEIKALFEQYYKKQKYASNIGFLYAYNDPEYVGKYFLIDGQQRVTTIYLILLALCVKIDKSIFEKYYYTNSDLKVDYKVRDTAHVFMNEFVKYILSGSNHSKEDIKQQYWYFSSNDLDPTVQSIIGNYNHIHEFLERNNLFNEDFLNYVQHFIEFWYFDTNLSDQGEELYIYMNARGEQIQTNENLKADLLGKLKTEDIELVKHRDDYSETADLNGLKNYWGKKWETWQDFFWLRKDENENADVGFNEFINCIAGLELYKNKLINAEYSSTKLNDLLTLINIEINIGVLEYLENEKGNFKSLYNYSDWVDNYYNLIWNYINKATKRNANWFVNYQDKNKNDDRNNMVLLWSLFYYYEDKNDSLNKDEFFRVMRFFYVRFHNYNRSVPTLKKTIDLLSINGIIDSIDNELGIKDSSPEEETDTKYRTKEETEKYTFLSGFIANPELLRQYESLIWEIEDHKYNLDGSYLGNINISHLIDFSANPIIEYLKSVRDRFFQLMKYTEGDEEANLVTLLLHYGSFAAHVSPWYYQNYQFDNWRRVLRNVDGDKTAFKDFFKEFMDTDEIMPLSHFLNKKNLVFLELHKNDILEITEIRAQLITYSMLLGKDLWKVGNHMAYEANPEMRLFNHEPRIFNSKRYYGSAATWYLWEEVKQQFGEDREAIKSILLNKQQELI